MLKTQGSDLAQAISLTPYARDVFDDAHVNRGTYPFDRAYRFAIRSRMGHGFKSYEKTGFKIDVQARERSYALRSWNKMPDLLIEAAIRLKNVQIENRPAIELIKKFNYENVCIYSDPPYLSTTRGGKQYRHEMMSDADHLQLLEILLQHKGSVIISGYPSALYDDTLKGWHKITKKSYNQNADQRTEVLWCNFALQPTFFDQEVHDDERS